MKKLIQILMCAFLACSADVSHAEKVEVVASIFPLGDMVRQIGGEKADVKVMMPPGASPHTYEPTPFDMMEIQRARVFVMAGAGLEFWAEKMLKAAGSKKLIIVIASSGLPLISEIHSHGSSGGSGTDSRLESADPHVWLDPVFAMDIAERIKRALSEADPEGKTYYAERHERYRKELESLHRDISGRIKNFRIKDYVTFHAAWNYFSRRYGLKVAGVIEESPGRDPSPRHIAELIEEVKRIKSKVIFAEPQFNPKIAEVIAAEAGAKVLFLDPVGGPDIGGRDTYIGLMRYNLSVMEKAMR